MANHNFVVLLAGGQGSRFWPQSRTLEPKQFLTLHKNQSLFEATLDRIRALVPPDNVFIATSELYRTQIQSMIHSTHIPLGNILFEPSGKNTAASIAATVRLIGLRDLEANIAVLPCDHFIKNNKKFLALLRKAFSFCHDHLIVFGIVPYRPATGYGYIRSSRHSPHAGKGIYEVDRFCEKPALKIARRFLKDRRMFWNSGIFVGSAKVFENAFKVYLPGLHHNIATLRRASDVSSVWHKIKPISFDFGVLEKADNLRMLKAEGIGWSDLGSWQAWDEMVKKDKEGNVLFGDVINLGSRSLTVLGHKRVIATIGLEDLIVVDTPDALLITKKCKSEEVKAIVDVLKAKKRPEHYFHRTVKRPWGSYTVLDNGFGFKIKLVEVFPKKSLSLQKHRKRSEHWVVVEGEARIQKGCKNYRVCLNESTYIPRGCVHRLTNPTNSILRIVEVQTGGYLEEDDIVRLKDDFDRIAKTQGAS